MEEFFQILLGLVVLVIGIAAVIIIATLILSFGIFIGSIIATINYYKAFTENIYLQKIAEINLDHEDQPALKSYFFKKWYIDLRNVIQSTWYANLDSASTLPDWMDVDQELISGSLHIVMFITIMLFGTITLLITSIIHVSLMLLIEGLYFLFFTVLRTLESMYLTFHKFFISCPSCYNKYSLPTFHCSNCHIAHTKLIPGPYGILQRTCVCGTKLSTSFLNGRNSLEKSCSSCQASLSDEVISKTNTAFPIIGLTNSGKSTYLFALAHEIMKQNSAIKLADTSKDTFQQMTQLANQGVYLFKTVDNKPMAFNLIADNTMIHLYDHAGELYNEVEQMKELPYYHYLSGIFFVIDSSMIYQNKNLTDVTDLLHRLRETLAQAFNISNENKVPLPIAIVLNRFDLNDIQKTINIDSIESIQSLKPILNILENNFEKYNFFPCSSIGDNYGVDFKPYGVIEAYNWLNFK